MELASQGSRGIHGDVLNFQVKYIREGMIVLAMLATGSSWTTDPDPSAQCLSQRCCALAFHHLSNGSSSAAGPRQNRRRLTMRLSQHLLLCPRLRCTAKLDTDKFGKISACVAFLADHPAFHGSSSLYVQNHHPAVLLLNNSTSARTNTLLCRSCSPAGI